MEGPFLQLDMAAWNADEVVRLTAAKKVPTQATSVGAVAYPDDPRIKVEDGVIPGL